MKSDIQSPRMHLIDFLLSCLMLVPLAHPEDVRILGPDRISLCNVTNATVQYTCVFRLTSQRVNSFRNYQIMVDTSNGFSGQQENQEGDDYRVSRQFSFAEGGIHYVKCGAKQNGTNMLHVLVDRLIVVFDPPVSPPVLYTNNDTLPIRNGDVHYVSLSLGSSRLDLKCEATSGRPKPQRFRFQCGDEVEEVRGSTAKSQFEIQAIKQRCSCQVMEEIECMPPLITYIRIEPFYGPTVVRADTEKTYARLCSNHSMAYIICEVPVATVNPEPLMEVIGLSKTPLTPVGTHLINGFYRFRFQYQPKAVEHLTATCTASSRIDPGITAKDEVMILVAEPPPSAPVISVNDSQVRNQTAYIGKAKVMNVSCHVNGGFPEVKAPVLTCGQRRSVNGEPLQLPAHRTACTCNVSNHLSGCYDKEESVVIVPKVASRITQFVIKTSLLSKIKVINGTLDKGFTSLVVDRGENVTFVCEGAGLPPPTVQLYIGNTAIEASMEYESHHTRAEHSHYASGSEASGRVKCKASNGFEETATATVDILVEGPLEFIHEHDVIMHHTVEYDSHFELTLEVKGYPKPTSIKLFQGDGIFDVNASDYEWSELNPTDDYKSRLGKWDLNKGTVVVSLLDSNPDEGFYMCQLSNGLGIPLNYPFHLSIDYVNLYIYLGLGFSGGIILISCIVCGVWQGHKENLQEQREKVESEQKRNRLHEMVLAEILDDLMPSRNYRDGLAPLQLIQGALALSRDQNNGSGAGTSSNARGPPPSRGQRGLPPRPPLASQTYDDVERPVYEELLDIVLDEYEQPDGFLEPNTSTDNRNVNFTRDLTDQDGVTQTRGNYRVLEIISSQQD